ncbi:MAG: hypothetical protein J6572_11250 [Gilliamella sp.]|nr:hypothetical protein [Gilliamella sp.]
MGYRRRQEPSPERRHQCRHRHPWWPDQPASRHQRPRSLCRRTNRQTIRSWRQQKLGRPTGSPCPTGCHQCQHKRWSGVSLNTVINTIALKRGKPLSINEIKAITTRYNNKARSLITTNRQVLKNNGRSSTTSESLEAKQSGGKGANETKTRSNQCKFT